MRIKRATIQDLPTLMKFTTAEAEEAEQLVLNQEQLQKGISEALADSSKAMYWLLVSEEDIPTGSISVVLEWSDWRGGYYWWIQSAYLKPAHRGKGYLQLLVNWVKSEMENQNGLELRLYVHIRNKAAIKAYEKNGFKTLDYRIMKLA